MTAEEEDDDAILPANRRQPACARACGNCRAGQPWRAPCRRLRARVCNAHRLPCPIAQPRPFPRHRGPPGRRWLYSALVRVTR
ncbi:hypothetical protein XcmpCFBP7700_10135 [Xanthomonas campestris]|nr:hypothetical protein XcmpCFBP7700_10135 [Xanthomonas campestris]